MSWQPFGPARRPRTWLSSMTTSVAIVAIAKTIVRLKEDHRPLEVCIGTNVSRREVDLQDALTPLRTLQQIPGQRHKQLLSAVHRSKTNGAVRLRLPRFR